MENVYIICRYIDKYVHTINKYLFFTGWYTNNDISRNMKEKQNTPNTPVGKLSAFVSVTI